MPREDYSGKFAESLFRTNKSIRDDRAAAIIRKAELKYRRHIEDLEEALVETEMEQENILDLSPTDARSLKLASDFKEEEFIAMDTDLAIRTRNLRIRIFIAKQRFALLFGGDTPEPPSDLIGDILPGGDPLDGDPLDDDADPVDNKPELAGV